MARIIFDLDGTLVHSTPTLCRAGNVLLRKLGRGPVSEEVYVGFVGRGIPHQIMSLLAHTGGIPGDDLKPHLAFFRQVYDADPVLGTMPYDGVLMALEILAGSGHRLGVCTQKPMAPTLAILAATGMRPLISGITAGDSLDVLKPDPAMLAHTARQLGQGPQVYVGDSETDAMTAANAGVLFLLHTNGYRRAALVDITNDGIFGEFRELPALVGRILEP